MAMRNPWHLGEIVLHDWIGGLDLSVEAAVERMQVSAESLGDIWQGKAPVMTAMAARLSKALGSIPRFCIQYAAAQAEAMLDQFNIERIEAAAGGGGLGKGVGAVGQGHTGPAHALTAGVGLAVGGVVHRGVDTMEEVHLGASELVIGLEFTRDKSTPNSPTSAKVDWKAVWTEQSAMADIARSLLR